MMLPLGVAKCLSACIFMIAQTGDLLGRSIQAASPEIMPYMPIEKTSARVFPVMRRTGGFTFKDDRIGLKVEIKYRVLVK